MMTITVTALVLFAILTMLCLGHLNNMTTELVSEVGHVYDRLEALEKEPEPEKKDDPMILLTQARVDRIGETDRFTVTAVGEIPVRIHGIASASLSDEFKCTCVTLFSGQAFFVTEEPIEVARRMGVSLPAPGDFTRRLTADDPDGG